jgi:tRNA A37 threonylcarbamoyladenosine dehydratase
MVAVDAAAATGIEEIGLIDVDATEITAEALWP